MRRSFHVLLALGLVAGVMGEARAETPLQFMQRFLANPASVLKVKPVRKVRPKPAMAAVPLPHLRPVKAAAAPVLGYQVSDDAADDLSTDDMPIPRLRPADLLPALTAPQAVAVAPPPADKAAPPVTTAEPPNLKLAMIPDEPAPPPPKTTLPKLIRPPPAATSTCGIAIARLGVIAKPLAPIEEGDCGIEAPVAVSALDGGNITLSTSAIVDCHLAERLAGWVADTVAPKVREAYGGELTGLRIAASYACRNRDNLADAKLSEHAHGNAIDISAFRVGERWIEVGPGWSGGGDDLSFLTDVRKSACGPFTTVLGPGSDTYHTDHFHLDMIARRTAGPSKGLYCR